MDETKKTELLKINLDVLGKSLSRLLESYSICCKICIKNELSANEYREFESFTSRFARTVDLFINKGLRSLYKVELEDPGSVIDLLNKAEKREIIDSSETWKKIKELRNSIAHDYNIENPESELFKPVLESAPIIEKSIANLKSYCSRYF